MKVIIAGSRTLTDYDVLLEAISLCPFEVTEIVSGGARGVDTFAEILAEEFDIPLTIFPAKWDLYGKSAGYKRNVEMAEYADALCAIWDGKSKGTLHMVTEAKRKNLKVCLIKVTNGIPELVKT